MSAPVTKVASRVKNGAQTHSMELLFFPLFILVGVGLVSNNFQSTALATTPVLPATCQVFGQCFPTNENGCDLSVQNCNFTSSTSFNFLNPNSPFTALFSGNVGAFANSFTAASQAGNPTSQPFTLFPNATTVTDAQPNATGANTFFIGCLNDNGTLWYLLLGNNEKLNCWQFFSNETIVPQTYSKLYNGNLPPTPHNANLNCTVMTNAITTFSYQFIGCDNYRALNQSQVTPTAYRTRTLLLAFNSSIIQNAPNSGNASKTSVFLYGWAWMPNEQNTLPLIHTNSNDMQVCADLVDLGYSVSQTTSCQAATASVHQTICATAAGSSACMQTTGVGSFILGIGLVAGVVFLILGLGLGFNIGVFTAVFGMSNNDQGTKLMQALGVGLVTWSFIFSEFGGWLSGLPFNLNIIGFLTFTTMFFLGLYWRLFSVE